jgi:uncharacterized protein (DUF2237 family)
MIEPKKQLGESTTTTNGFRSKLNRQKTGQRSNIAEAATASGHWKGALEAGVALPVDLEATHSYALEFLSLEELQAHALSPH